jgi:excisionase family DNA binding protein
MTAKPSSPSAGPAEFVTVGRACEMYSVSQPTIYKLIREGKIRAVKLGRATRIEAGTIRRHFASLPAAKSISK